MKGGVDASTGARSRPAFPCLRAVGLHNTIPAAALHFPNDVSVGVIFPPRVRPLSLALLLFHALLPFPLLLLLLLLLHLFLLFLLLFPFVLLPLLAFLLSPPPLLPPLWLLLLLFKHLLLLWLRLRRGQWRRLLLALGLQQGKKGAPKLLLRLLLLLLLGLQQ